MEKPASSHFQRERCILGGTKKWTVSDIVDIAKGKKLVVLSTNKKWRSKLQESAAFLDRYWRDGNTIYGVTTGYGDSCNVAVPSHLVEELPIHLTRFHGCGLGNIFNEEAAAAILATRLSSLAQGYSGVRIKLLQQLVSLINLKVLPVIPEEGSVGASGDLTPLSYVAAVVMGERDVWYDGEKRNTKEVLKEVGLPPLKLKPKEALAIMNGTSVMTALACLAYHRSDYLIRLGSRITALMVKAIKGNVDHFHPKLFTVKPFPGQTRIANWIHNDLYNVGRPENGDNFQDRYSIRCAPHVLGVLADSLPWMKNFIETELNSTNDNPIIDGECQSIYHGGHFYGGHIGFVMDCMKNAVANCADLFDRQMVTLMDGKANNGLPANLSGAVEARAAINHGFKAVQVAVSAWTAEALKLTLPASVFSRSTENHNQDKVSMGTIAARDCLRVLDLSEQVAAGCLLASVQGIELRRRRGELPDNAVNQELREMCDAVSHVFPFLDEDRPLESTLREMVSKIREQAWPLYQKYES